MNYLSFIENKIVREKETLIHTLSHLASLSCREPPVSVPSRGVLIWAMMSPASSFLTMCMICLLYTSIEIGPVDMLIDSNVPRGGGLSSSAALEVAVCKALTAFASSHTETYLRQA